MHSADTSVPPSPHLAADICDKPIRPDLQGFAEAATYNLNITALAPGNYGYICTVGDHCTMGNMNVVIIVKNC